MYSLEFLDNPARTLSRIFRTDQKLYSRLVASIESLKENPFQGKRLKGKLAGDFSMRIGDYRVIYTIEKRKLIVYIIDLGHRRDIYR